MMENKCEIIRDLLPLYRDNVCSEASGELVEEHLKTCEGCRMELEKINEEITGGNDMNESEQISRVADAWKVSKRRAFFKGTLIVALIACIGCGIAFNMIGSYVADDGTLVEPFALIPLAWLCALIALISAVVLLTGKLIHRRK